MEAMTPTFLRMFYDAEFTGLQKNTTPISIGLVSDTWGTFYAEFTDYDESQVTDWINENIINRLQLSDKPDGYINQTPVMDKPMYSPRYSLQIKGNTEFIKSELIGWLANESYCAEGRQIQFHTDCYAYDWMILNDLIGLNGSALEIPTYVNYIPIDLSSLLYFGGVDPDISREEFIGDFEVQSLQKTSPFLDWGKDMKHNSLWDAFVCRQCFSRIGYLHISK